MSRVYDALRAGDALRIDGTGYVAAGRLVLRTPDGSHWSEWLLVPADSTSALALKDQTHRWLCRDDHGLSLWRPEPPPPGLQPQTLERGQACTIDGHHYRVALRDSVKVERIEGDVGGDVGVGVGVGTAYEFAELHGGQRLLTLEWDAHGTAMTRFRRIGEHDLVAWSRAAGTALAQRAGLQAKAGAGARGRNTGVVAAADQARAGSISLLGIGFAIVMAIVIFLDSCDRDDRDCVKRYNQDTGQLETVCDDGVRSRNSGRRFGGWNGK